MRNIVKVLLNEGIEREDVVKICKYIKENYKVNESDETDYAKFQDDMDSEILARRAREEAEQKRNLEAIAKADKERAEFEARRNKVASMK